MQGVGSFGDDSVVVDSMGQTWEKLGPLAEQRWVVDAPTEAVVVEAALEQEPMGKSGGAASPTEDGSFIAATDAGDWVVYQLTDPNEDGVAEAVEAYDAYYAFIEDLPEIPFEGANAQARIVGVDDRNVLSVDQLTVGGDDDNFVAIRNMDNVLMGTPSGGTTNCTATMISPTIGITAAHCVHSSGTWNTAMTLTVCNGRHNANSCMPIDLYFVNGSYYNNRYVRNDWALFRTVTPVSTGSANPWTLDGTTNEGVGTTVSQVGTPSDVTRAVAHSGCSIRGLRTKMLIYDCDTVGGHSGGPVYRIFGSGSTRFRQIVAVHAAAYFPNNRGARVSYWRANMISAMNSLTLGGGVTPVGYGNCPGCQSCPACP